MNLSDITCPGCSNQLTSNSVFYVNRKPRVTCSTCGHKITEAELTVMKIPTMAQRIDPIVYHEGPNGEIRLPASPDAPVPAGYQRAEARNMAEGLALERRVNAAEMRRYDDHASREQAMFEQASRMRRAELFNDMKSMSNYGRDFARHAMEQRDKRIKAGRFDPGFHIEVLHKNASNREQYRDERTGWKGRKG